jgi:cytidine deaminase
MTKSGNVYKGTFLENSSYGLTICAEPAAIMAANTNGDFEISSIAIVGGDPAKDKSDPVTPCGRCRQVIYEASTVSGLDIDIYCSDLNLSKVLITKISELLPLPFFKSDFSI